MPAKGQRDLNAYETKDCRKCGESFTSLRSAKRAYCSAACYGRKEGQRDPEKWTKSVCPQCGESFEYLNCWPRKFCSNICAGKANVVNIAHFAPSRFIAICEECGESFETTPKQTRGRFCSRTCFGKWLSKEDRCAAGRHNRGRKLGRPANAGPVVTKPCEVCGNEFVTKASHQARRRTCSKLCYGALLATLIAGENNFNWKGGYDPYYGPSWRPAMREARKRDKVCVDCGKTPKENGRALDVHHIIPFRLFGLECHIEANDLSNLVALCKVCHLLREPRRSESFLVALPSSSAAA